MAPKLDGLELHGNEKLKMRNRLILLGTIASMFLFILLFALWFFPGKYTYEDQQAAVCSQGRPHDELESYIFNSMAVTRSLMSSANASIANSEMALSCKTLVYVHACLDEDIEAERWNLQCSSMLREVTLTFHHPLYTEIRCSEQEDESLLYHCNSTMWLCAVGNCTAAKYAQEVCTAKVAREPYGCFFVKSDLGSGIVTESKEYPSMAEVGFIVSLLFSCLFVASIAYLLECHPRRGPAAQVANQLRRALSLPPVRGFDDLGTGSMQSFESQDSPDVDDEAVNRADLPLESAAKVGDVLPEARVKSLMVLLHEEDSPTEAQTQTGGPQENGKARVEVVTDSHRSSL